MLDHFQMGPQLVRGFAPNGIGPRDITQYLFDGIPGDALGGTKYWGASLEFQTPIYFLPKDSGIKVAAFADAGSLWDYVGPRSWLPPSPGATGETLALSTDGCSSTPLRKDSCMFINSSVGVGLLWASPFGPLRFDFALPLTKTPYDRKQWFRFGGGTTF
jgi:outer membrane protein insertion porin family